MNVVLVSPPNPRQSIRHAESLGIRYLAAVAERAGYKAVIIDAHCWGWDLAQTVKAVVEAQPTLIGIQLIFHEQVPAAIDIANQCLSSLPNVQFLAGGHVPTFSPAELLSRIPMLDGIIRGEGEVPFVSLLQQLAAGVALDKVLSDLPGAASLRDGKLLENPQSPLITKIDDLPFPARDVRDFSNSRLGSLIGSRGCYAACEFCSVPPFFQEAKGPKWRLRTAGNLFAEMTALQDRYEVTHFSFLDDIFLARDARSRRRALELAHMLMDTETHVQFSIECRTDAVDYELFAVLAKAGLARVFIGIEAGDDKTLESYNKCTTAEQNRQALDVLRRLNISVAIGYILFHPDIGIDELKSNLSFMRDAHILTKRSVCSRLSAYPGTPIWHRLKKAGRLVGDELSPSYIFANTNMDTLVKTLRKELAPLDEIDVLFQKTEFQVTFWPRPERMAAEKALALLRAGYSEDLFGLAMSFLDLCYDGEMKGLDNAFPNHRAISKQIAAVREFHAPRLDGIVSRRTSADAAKYEHGTI